MKAHEHKMPVGSEAFCPLDLVILAHNVVLTDKALQRRETGCLVLVMPLACYKGDIC